MGLFGFVAKGMGGLLTTGTSTRRWLGIKARLVRLRCNRGMAVAPPSELSALHPWRRWCSKQPKRRRDFAEFDLNKDGRGEPGPPFHRDPTR